MCLIKAPYKLFSPKKDVTTLHTSSFKDQFFLYSNTILQYMLRAKLLAKLLYDTARTIPWRSKGRNYIETIT